MAFVRLVTLQGNGPSIATITRNGVGKVVYGKKPDAIKPQDVSVIVAEAGPGSLSGYDFEVVVELGHEDWPVPYGSGWDLKALEEQYTEMAFKIRDQIAMHLASGVSFYVWVKGEITGFAEGEGEGWRPN